jgi:hypothetical protein
MITKLVRDHVYEGVLKDEKSEAMSAVVKEIVTRNMDNRILNNLRQQVNEMVNQGDSRAIIPLEAFKTLWFTYFKGEQDASLILDMVLPHIC